MEQKTVEVLEKELNESKERVKELEQSNEDLQIEISEKENEINELNKQVEELDDDVKELNSEIEELELAAKSPFPSETMHDNMKTDYLLEIWEHYTPYEIESALPRKN